MDITHYLCDIILEKSVLQSSNVLSVYICKWCETKKVSWDLPCAILITGGLARQ